MLALAIGLAWPGAACGTSTETARVEIRGAVLRCAVARTPEDRERGLSGRPPLADGEGMLFVFPERARHGFWMKDMRFSIDIVWIAQGRIVDLALELPPEGRRPSRAYRPRSPARYVLEVAAGTARQEGWRIGDPVGIALPRTGPPDR